MNPEESRLENEIARELGALKELRAPEELLTSVLGEIERHAARPWYRQPWPAWPLAAQAVAFLFFAMVFCGTCLGIWTVLQAEGLGAAAQRFGSGMATVGLIGEALWAVITALASVLQSMGSWVVAVCLVVSLTSYAACVGLGTVFVKFAFIRRNEIRL